MLIGPHVGKDSDPNMQRRIAKAEQWTALQTNFGNTQSFSCPTDYLYEKPQPREDEIFYSWHCPYVLTINPKPENREGAASFLSQIIRLAKKWEIDCLVIHTGSVVGVPAEQAIAGMLDFIESNDILVQLERANTRLAIEFGASVCGMNLYPGLLAQTLWQRYSGVIGYCVDLAHVPASGCSWQTIRTLIEEIPPIVSHINFCGADIGSSQDNHGNLLTPHIVKKKRIFCERDKETTEFFVSNHIETLKLLKDKNVPMILEGSGFPKYNIIQELNQLKKILNYE